MRWLCQFLALAFVLALFAGCEKSTKNSGEGAKETEKKGAVPPPPPPPPPLPGK